MSALVTALRSDLTTAMKARDRAGAALLRTVLAAIANAEAVDVVDDPTADGSADIAGATSGVGRTESPRRDLNEDDIRAVIAAERDDLLRAAEAYAEAGSGDEAERLRGDAHRLRSYL